MILTQQIKQLVYSFSFLLFVIGCGQKEKTTERYFHEVKWAIRVPDDLKAQDSAGSSQLNDKGKAVLEKAFDTTLDFSATKTLISIQQGLLNNLSATITPFDPKVDGRWEDANYNIKAMMMETFHSQTPGAQIDTSSSKEFVGGLEFDVFKIEMVLPNNIELTSLMYSKFHRGYDFGITMTYENKKTGERFKKILKESTFTK